MTSESSSTAANNNNNQSKSLVTANHHNAMTSTDIVATTKQSNKSTRQYKSNNCDNKDIAVDSMHKISKTTPTAASSSATNTTTNSNATTSSSASSMASSNRRQSIHRSVKSTKQPSTTSVLSAAVSTSNTSTVRTSSTLQTATTPSNQYQENDTFLSLSNPTYKSVLYTHFQQMNNNDTREEEKRVATKIINIFKKNGGRFYKKSGRGNVQKEMTFVQVDEDAALRKIQDDIRRRRENAQHWQHQQQTSISPSEAADIPSPSISTTQSKVDKKKKSSKKSISIVRREAAKLGWENRRKKSEEQSNDNNDEEDMAVDEDSSSMSNLSTSETRLLNKDDNAAEMSIEDKKKSSTAPATVVKKEIKKRESKARTVKLTHPHASDAKARSSPTSTSSTNVVKKQKKKSKTPVKKTKKSMKPRAGKSQQKATTVRAARSSEKEQTDAQQVTKSNGMTEWQCPKCSKKFAWKSPQCAGACISNHMRKSHGITLPTMKELSQKKKGKKSVDVKSTSTRHVVGGGTSRSSRSSTSVSSSASSSSTASANQQPKQQEKTRPKRGRESSTKKASVTFDSDIQSYLGEEPAKKKRKGANTSASSRGGRKKTSVKDNTPSQAVSKSKRAAPSRRRSSAKTTNHVTPTSTQKSKSPDSSTSLVVIESSSSSSAEKSGTNNKLNFAQKLHAMINDANENHPDTLCWNEDGDSFIVKERDTPLQPLLSRYFRTTKYTSLYRSLANYGFVADYVKIQEKDVVCFMREDFTRDSTPTELSCFTKDKATTAEKIVSVKEEAASDSRRSVPKRKAFTNACGVIQGAMTEEDDTSPIKDEEEDDDAFEVGQRIEARYRGQGRRWYKGTIVASLGNGLYDIDYDDGDSDRSLSSDAIRVRMPRRKKIPKKQKQQQKSAEQPRIGEEDNMMMIDTFSNNTQQQSAPLLNERQRIIFDLVSGREVDGNDDSVDKENTNKAGVGLFSPIKAKRVTFADSPSTSNEEERGVEKMTDVEVANDSSFSPIKPFNQVKSKDNSSMSHSLDTTTSLAKSTTQQLSSPTQVVISSKSQAEKKKEQVQPFVLVKVGVIDNEVVMPPGKEDDDTSFQQDTANDTFQGLLSPESDSNTPSSKDPGDDLFHFNWDGRASSSDDFLADEIGFDLFSTNRMTTSSSYPSRRGTYASGRGTMYPSYPSGGHGKARTSSSWDKIRL